MTIKDIVKNTTAKFDFYRNQELWYYVRFWNPDKEKLERFEFPVPISDCGDAIFLRDDKAILFMRYIRKHMDSIEKAKKDHNDSYGTLNQDSKEL